MEIQAESRFVEVDLGHYFRLFRSKWWLLALVSLVSIAIGYGYFRSVVPRYRASTTLLVDALVGSTDQDLNALRASQTRAQTFAQLIVQRPVLEETIERLNLSMGIGVLRSQVTVTPIPNTQLIRITVENPNGEVAAILANTIATTFIDQNVESQAASFSSVKEEILSQMQAQEELIQQTIDDIAALDSSDEPADMRERNRLELFLAQYNGSLATMLRNYEQVRLTEIESTSRIIQSEVAIAATRPVWPNRRFILLISAVAGLFLASVLILFQDYLDDRIKSPDTIAQRFGLLVIGQIGSFNLRKQSLIARDEPRSPIAEAFRIVRLNLRYLAVDRQLRTILVTSATDGEGKSTFSANLAVILAQGGQKTMLIDGDLRRPTVHKRFELGNDRGFSDLFINPTGQVEQVIQYPDVTNLSVISTGRLPPNPSELLDSNRAREIISKSDQWAEVMVIDSPPLLAVTDAVALSQYVDGVILIVRAGKTKIETLKAAVNRLRRVDANLLGVVMVDTGARSSRYGSYYYNYDAQEVYQSTPAPIKDTSSPAEPA